MERITIRIDDDRLKKKLRKIARKNGRSLSREIEQILIKFVEHHEKRNGEIKVD